jgi:CBS-domain-containing membrane protein
MTKAVVTCSPGDTIAQISKVMTYQRIRHMPVTEGKRLVGIISSAQVDLDIGSSIRADRETNWLRVGVDHRPLSRPVVADAPSLLQGSGKELHRIRKRQNFNR